MVPICVRLQNSTLRGVLKRLHFPLEVMLVCVRWYAAYPLSLRNLEETMAERGVLVDHTTVHRWAEKMLPVLAKGLSPAQACGGHLVARGPSCTSRSTSTIWSNRTIAR
jgi:transposase-like protein